MIHIISKTPFTHRLTCRFASPFLQQQASSPSHSFGRLYRHKSLDQFLGYTTLASPIHDKDSLPSRELYTSILTITGILISLQALTLIVIPVAGGSGGMKPSGSPASSGLISKRFVVELYRYARVPVPSPHMTKRKVVSTECLFFT